MKKFACVLASMLLALSAVGAMADTVPSKTTTDVTQVKTVEAVKEDGTVEAVTGWDIEVAEDAAPVTEEIAKIYQEVFVNGKTAVAYFPAETQEAIAALLPEGVNASKLMMNEFITLEIVGKMETATDVKVTFTFTTKYEMDQNVVVVIGLYDGTRDANGQYNVEWVALDAEVLENGDIAVVFPAELVEQMNDAAAVAMAVLNDEANWAGRIEVRDAPRFLAYKGCTKRG